MKHITNGPGLTVLSLERTYGRGYCGICGDTKAIVPRLVRYWDPDDGWRVGVLCACCTGDAAARGPRSTDYAYRPHDQRAELMDALAGLGDADSTLTECEELP